MSWPWKAVRMSLRKYGPWGTARRAVATTWSLVRPRRPAAPSQFDVEFNVDTAGIIPAYRTAIDGDDLVHASGYERVYPKRFRLWMEQAGGEAVARDRTFVDIGCGKGMALL